MYMPHMLHVSSPIAYSVRVSSARIAASAAANQPAGLLFVQLVPPLFPCPEIISAIIDRHTQVQVFCSVGHGLMGFRLPSNRDGAAILLLRYNASSPPRHQTGNFQPATASFR